MTANITTLTEATFDEEVKGSDTPVLVDFWATWCPPCRVIAPILEDISTEKAGVLRIAKVDVDENPGLSQRFEIQSIPTMILFKDGSMTTLRIIGAKSKAQILQDIQAFL